MLLSNQQYLDSFNI